MQTFLPYESFIESAKCLDYRRLGKQRLEAYQILRTLTGKSKGWVNHPAVKMWQGHEWQLYLYALDICKEWRNRGYKDTLRDKLMDMMGKYPALTYPNRIPSWLGGPIHASHRSNLLRKNKEFYGKYSWNEPDTLAYVWPVR